MSRHTSQPDYFRIFEKALIVAGTDASLSDFLLRHRRRDLASKASRDPLTHITSLLASSSSSSSSKPKFPPLPSSRSSYSHMPPPSSTTSLSTSSAPLSPTSSRLAREASERARAQALIASAASASARRHAHGSVSSSSTPTVSSGSTVGGRTPSGYEERRFYPEDVRRAQKGRERGDPGRNGLDGVRWDDERSSSGYHGGSSSSRRSSGNGSERGSGYGGRYREV